VLTKIWLAVMVAITLLYAFLLFERGWVLLQDGQPVAIAMGLAILVFPLLAIATIYYEIRFGLRLAKLGKLFLASGMKAPEYVLKPSGRAEQESGKRVFQKISSELEKDEHNFLLWYLLADCYDKLGDRKRARFAARQAISRAKKAHAL
jgi:4-amino-4-deoxy-L-arabinose transferase-like glycosyltransferase